MGRVRLTRWLNLIGGGIEGLAVEEEGAEVWGDVPVAKGAEEDVGKVVAKFNRDIAAEEYVCHRVLR